MLKAWPHDAVRPKELAAVDRDRMLVFVLRRCLLSHACDGGCADTAGMADS